MGPEWFKMMYFEVLSPNLRSKSNFELILLEQMMIFISSVSYFFPSTVGGP